MGYAGSRSGPQGCHVGTANSNSPISVREANAVIALDTDTGAHFGSPKCWPTIMSAPRRWTGPGVCTTREADFTGGVILRKLPNGKRVILAGAKSGEVYAFDPDNSGKLLWHNQTHDASTLSGRWGFAAYSRSLYINSNSVIPAYGRGAPTISRWRCGPGSVHWSADLVRQARRDQLVGPPNNHSNARRTATARSRRGSR